MKLVNLTPHKIAIYASTQDDKPSIVLDSTGRIARVASWATEVDHEVGKQFNIPVHRAEFGQVVGLPEFGDDTAYVVSGMVLDALKHIVPPRPDVFAPGELLRSPDGQIKGCLGLRCN